MKVIVYMKSLKADYNATAVYEDGKITVIKGSKIRKENPNFKRMKILSDYRIDRTIVDENYILKKNITFNSPSTAAQFVGDSSRNGLIYWRNEENIKLKNIIGG
jgi:hypothetical protein